MIERTKSEMLLSKKLNSVQVNPPDGMWEAIDSSLSMADMLYRRRQTIRKVICGVSAAAVIVVSAIISLPYLSDNHVSVEKAVAVVESAKEMKYEASDTPVQVAPSIVSVAEQATNSCGVNSKASTQLEEKRGEEVAKNSNDIESNERKALANSIDSEQKILSQNVTNEQNAVLPQKVCESKSEEKKYYETNYKIDDFAALEYGESIAARNRKRYLLSFSSNVAPGANTDVNSGFKMASFGEDISSSIKGVSVVERTSEIKYSLPFSVGVQLQIKLSKNLNLGAGINYSYLRSKYDGLINKKPYNIKQSLHYIGIPVNIYALFPYNSKFIFYVNAGGTIEKGIRAVNRLKSYNESYRISNSISGVQYSINGGLGFEYKFNNSTGIYIEPNAAYYFNSDVPASIRTDQPFQFKVELGFRIHL